MSRTMIPEGYLVSFFEEGSPAAVEKYVPMPSLPAEGMRVAFPATQGRKLAVYEVAAVEVILFAPDSWAADHGQPLCADVIMRPSRGVHEAEPDPEVSDSR